MTTILARLDRAIAAHSEQPAEWLDAATALTENLVATAPDLRSLLEAYDAIQKERDDSEAELEDLELSLDYHAAEKRRDMLDGWAEREAYIAGRLIHLLRAPK
ncbi:hypothetical protein ACFV9C_41935 [Kribbella sp. NPDC059898]|uniref:hypothetical protein n=1 Tax=Kribbella sp. NPDC059898 TaxID=3346995 RepID=UPI003651DEB6